MVCSKNTTQIPLVLSLDDVIDGIASKWQAECGKENIKVNCKNLQKQRDFNAFDHVEKNK